MNLYTNIVSHIVKEQQSVVGPLALDLANHVEGLKMKGKNDISISGNPKEVLTRLVKEYAHLFGQVSIDVCKDAVKAIKPPIPEDDLPDILK